MDEADLYQGKSDRFSFDFTLSFEWLIQFSIWTTTYYYSYIEE